MGIMYHDEALEVIEKMRDTAVTDAANLDLRIKELEGQLVFDGWEETAKQIERLKLRLEWKVREAHALTLAAMTLGEKK